MTLAAPNRLAELEAVIERGMETFIEVGMALTEIRDERLYRDGHSTFEAYCRARWGWTRSRAYRLMDGASVAQLMSPTGDIPNERQARELVVLAKEDQQAAIALWAELRAQYGDSLTAALVRDAVDDRVGSDEFTAMFDEFMNTPTPDDPLAVLELLKGVNALRWGLLGTDGSSDGRRKTVVRAQRSETPE